MKGRFYTLTTMLAESAGLSCSCQIGDVVTSLYNDDILLHFMLDEESENTIIQVAVGIVPCHNKDILFEKLLQWNTMLSQAHGFSYSLHEGDVITLQGVISMQNADDEYTLSVFTHFVQEYVHSLENIESFLQDLALSA
ncbi:MAG: CesT family type III secretion system chaperone [Pseudomonadota bacterium]